MAIDLHLHTTHSDGSLTPCQLIDLLEKYQVTTAAITDHDVLSGIAEARECGRLKNIRIIPGVELSIDYPMQNGAHVHVLGLYVDVEKPYLVQVLEQLRVERQKRADEILLRLKKMNVVIEKNELRNIVSGQNVGRPHIAKILVEKGYAKTIAEAFEKYIGRNAPAYVPKKKLQLQEAIEVIHRVNGLAILAHPVSLKITEKAELFKKLDELVEVGLDGIEVFYSGHSPEFTKMLLEYVEQRKLVMSGGSDFHGEAKPEIKPVVGTGNLNIPPDIVKGLDAFYRQRITDKNSLY